MTKVSVVLATDGRAGCLPATLQGLSKVDFPDFEVIVVQGPTEDGTDAALAPWSGRLKRARCPERNLSRARNIGIGMAAGAVVAFLDDDAIPEPEWLTELTAPFDVPNVGVVGGFVLDHTGAAYQYRYATTDRLGVADLSWDRAAPELCFPFTKTFPHPLGANSAFRRSALVDTGGFDEEYDYFLDETDISCRLVDAGWQIAQVSGAHVHHKYQASAIRTDQKVLKSWYSVVKNKTYYACRNGRGHHSMTEIMDEVRNFVDGLRSTARWAVGVGALHEGDLDRLEREADAALAVGLQRGLSGESRLPEPDMFDAPADFLPFGERSAGMGRTFVLVSQEYPPTIVGGVGRYVHQLARSLADIGDHIHVVTKSAAAASVDLEDGVWVHRVPANPVREQSGLPAHIQAHADAVRDTVNRIAERRPVACVYAPIWDAEAISVLTHGDLPVVTGLQTTLRFWLESNRGRAADPAFHADFVKPMLAAEKTLLTESAALHAISDSILTEIEEAYSLQLGHLATMVPLGLEDAAVAPLSRAGLSGDPRILFVGRLESRKGIDVLLAAATDVLRRYPSATLDLVGNDTIQGEDGRTPREKFESDPVNAAIRARVRFHGAVSEARLRGFYAECDMLIAPSRFESFGLVLLEGMIFGKPVIGCRAGGMVEIVEENVTGLLAEPGDVASLTRCIERLADDPGLRARLGVAGRARYEARFTPAAMAADVRTLMLSVAS